MNRAGDDVVIRAGRHTQKLANLYASVDDHRFLGNAAEDGVQGIVKNRDASTTSFSEQADGAQPHRAAGSLPRVWALANHPEHKPYFTNVPRFDFHLPGGSVRLSQNEESRQRTNGRPLGRHWGVGA